MAAGFWWKYVQLSLTKGTAKEGKMNCCRIAGKWFPNLLTC